MAAEPGARLRPGRQQSKGQKISRGVHSRSSRQPGSRDGQAPAGAVVAEPRIGAPRPPQWTALFRQVLCNEDERTEMAIVTTSSSDAAIPQRRSETTAFSVLAAISF